MRRSHRILAAAILAIPALAMAQTSSLAGVFKLRGEAGVVGGPLPTEVESADGTSISLDLPNTLAVPTDGSRSATASGSVDSGVVRLSSEVNVTDETPNIGSILAKIKGSWLDTLTFESPGAIGDFTIEEGSTGGTADLIIDLSGSLQRIVGGNGDTQVSYGAELGIGCDPDMNCATTQRQSGRWDGIVGVEGDLSPVSSTMATASPAQLILTVPFVFGVEFVVGFELSVSAAYEGGGGTAEGDFLAMALFGSTAAWGGVQNVTAFNPSTNEDVVLTGSQINLTSPTFDYSTAVTPGTPVTAPAALPLFLSGLAALGFMRRRRKLH